MFRDYDPAWIGYALRPLDRHWPRNAPHRMARPRRHTRRDVHRLHGAHHRRRRHTSVRLPPHHLRLLAMGIMFVFYAVLLYLADELFWLVMHLLMPSFMMMGSQLESYGIWQKGMILYFLVAVVVHQGVLAQWLPKPVVRPKRAKSIFSATTGRITSRSLALMQSAPIRNFWPVALTLFASYTLAANLAIALHEFGHATGCWLAGGKVLGLVLAPQGYAGSYAARDFSTDFSTSHGYLMLVAGGPVFGAAFGAVFLVVARLFTRRAASLGSRRSRPPCGVSEITERTFSSAASIRSATHSFSSSSVCPAGACSWPAFPLVLTFLALFASFLHEIGLEKRNSSCMGGQRSRPASWDTYCSSPRCDGSCRPADNCRRPPTTCSVSHSARSQSLPSPLAVLPVSADFHFRRVASGKSMDERHRG